MLELLAATGAVRHSAAQLCEVCIQATGLTGAAIVLKSAAHPQGLVSVSGRSTNLLEELQFELGEGPSIEAFRTGQPVFEPDLASPEDARWPALAFAATSAGIRAVFAFPLEVAGARLGALSLFRDAAGALSDDQRADAFILADVVARGLLVLQAEAPDELAAELERRGSFRNVVHQATGMIAAQLDLDVVQAFVRLRAYAYGNERNLDDVAVEVVSRRLRFLRAANGDATAYFRGNSGSPFTTDNPPG